MSTPQTCALTPALQRYVQHQWRVIDVLFTKIYTATSNELHQLETAKLALEYVMATGRVDPSNEPLLKRFEKELLLEKEQQTLQTGLKKRFDRVGKTADTSTINIEHIKILEGLTLAHIEAIQEVFGGVRNLIPFILPTLEDLTNGKGSLSGTYEDVMYPNNQTDKEQQLVTEDKTNGLISYRPSHWGNDGTHHLHSMQQELTTLGGHLFLIDNTIKPAYIDGSQQYTTLDGSPDPLLPFIKETLKTDERPNPNRFNHSWNNLKEKLIPKVTEAIKEAFIKKGLPILNIQVMLIPAILANLYYTTHPDGRKSTINGSIESNTAEWSSTAYVPVGRRIVSEASQSLYVGFSDGGGASYVRENVRGRTSDYLGFRLAVML